MKSMKATLLLFAILLSSCSASSNYNQSELSKNVVVNKTSTGYSIIPECYLMDKGLIIYPGGLVDADAYIPLAVKIAEVANIAVFITKMPFNLAVLDSNGADKILKEYNYIDKWYISGHSLGGAMATSYIYDNPDIFSGLILLAAYPLDKKPLTDVDIKVISIKGSLDGLVDNMDIEHSKSNLPPGSIFIEIDGGNHAQFGSYGKQKGDNDSAISENEQQIETVKSVTTYSFFDFLSASRNSLKKQLKCY